MSTLTDKQKAFINRYIETLNATEAARQAKYKGNDVTLAAVGYENLRKPHLRAEIDRLLEEKAMGANELLVRVAQHARGNLAEYLDASGEPDIERLKADGLGHLLKKYKKVVKRTISKDGREYETEYYEAELYPADSAHDRLMKYHGLYDTKPSLGDKERPIEIKVTLSDD